MATAKSLKKLRSASTAFLEDGGAFLHGVDGLLRDIQRTIADVQRREQVLVERETSLNSRENHLDGMLQQLAERLKAREPNVPSVRDFPSIGTTSMDASGPANEKTIAEASETNLPAELTEILSTVAEVLTPPSKMEPTKTTFLASPMSRNQNQRKKRRR